MRVGLFGGSFDPIHAGHIRPVQAARRTLELDRVLYLPTGRPPHKSQRRFAPAAARFAMVEMALLGEEGLYASTFELDAREPSYTVDTVEHFRRILPSGTELHLLLGADSFLELHQWRRWRELAGAVRLVVMARPGWESERFTTEAHPDLIGQMRSGRVRVLDDETVNCSSSELREVLARGETPAPGLLPDLVVEYVRKYSFYR